MGNSEKDDSTPHPEVMWGCMFRTMFDDKYNWEQQGPLFQTMTKAAAYGEEQSKDSFHKFHVVPYEVKPAERDINFRDPNIDDPKEEESTQF